MNNQKLNISLIILATLLSRIFFLLSPFGQIGNADEAIFGMMAQKIMDFEEFPIFCWKAHYAGAFVSYIAAIIFHFFGIGFVQLRCAMLPFSILTSVFLYLIYEQLFQKKYAFICTIFVIFCPFLVLSYTSYSLGGYGETYLGTALIIWLSWRLQRCSSFSPRTTMLLGLACGFFFYLLFLVAPAIAAFALPAVMLTKKYRLKRILLFIGTFIIGMLPIIIYNIQNEMATFLRCAARSTEVDRSILNVDKAEIITTLIINKIIYLKYLILNEPFFLGHYLLPSYLGKICLSIAGIVLIICFLIFSFNMWSKTNNFKEYSLELKQFSMFFIFLIAFQMIVSFNRARHLLPVLIIIPVIVLNLSSNRKIRSYIVSVLAILCLFQLTGWKELFSNPCFNPYPIVKVMGEHKIKHFYGSYYTAYPIVFVGNGAFSCALFWGDFADRCPDMSKRVYLSKFPAFVFRDNEKAIEEKFLNFLKINDIQFRGEKTGGGIIYFNLNRTVHLSGGRKKIPEFFLASGN